MLKLICASAMDQAAGVGNSLIFLADYYSQLSSPTSAEAGIAFETPNLRL
jgi:hypothetical protein